MAIDMTNTLLDFFCEQFPIRANRDLDESDPLYLKEVLKGPLQDDPTLRAYYMIIQPDETLQEVASHWRVPVTAIKRGMLAANQEFPSYEIGGQFLMVNFFTMSGWLPLQDEKEDAYVLSGQALRRLEQAWAKMAQFDLFMTGVATDDGNETTQVIHPHPFTFDGGHFKLKGGESEWYGLLHLRFHVFSGINRDFYLEDD